MGRIMLNRERRPVEAIWKRDSSLRLMLSRIGGDRILNLLVANQGANQTLHISAERIKYDLRGLFGFQEF